MAFDADEFARRVEESLDKGIEFPDFPEKNPIEVMAMAMSDCCRNIESAGFSHPDALYITMSLFTGCSGHAPPGGITPEG